MVCFPPAFGFVIYAFVVFVCSYFQLTQPYLTDLMLKCPVIRVTHLRGEDVVGHIHHPVMVVTKALHFSHHRGLDSTVGCLISFLVDEDPSAEQKDTTQKVKELLKGSN